MNTPCTSPLCVRKPNNNWHPVMCVWHLNSKANWSTEKNKTLLICNITAVVTIMTIALDSSENNKYRRRGRRLRLSRTGDKRNHHHEMTSPYGPWLRLTLQSLWRNNDVTVLCFLSGGYCFFFFDNFVAVLVFCFLVPDRTCVIVLWENMPPSSYKKKNFIRRPSPVLPRFLRSFTYFCTF